MRLLIQIVYLNQSNSSGVVYTVDDGGVVARLQISNDRRLACRSRDMAAVLNVADLIAGDKTANHHVLARLHKAASADVAQGDSRRSCDCGLQSVDRNAFLAIARNASNCCDRRAKLVTMPRQRAIAGVYETVGAN